MATSIYLLFLLSVVVWANAQAPGDAASLCLSSQFAKTPYPPQFPQNLVPLMDSYDYQTLLSSPLSLRSDPWRSVDVDGDGLHWTQIENKTCRQTPQSCAFSAGKQNNWLITQYINTTVKGVALKQSGVLVIRVNFSLIGCLSPCKQSFLLQLYEVPNIQSASPLNISNYVMFTNSIVQISQNPTGTVTEIVAVPVPLTGKGGLYIGVQDIGTCASVNRLTVYYYICPQQVANLTVYPQTVANGPTAQLGCISGATTEGEQPPQATCGKLGEWGTAVGRCVCSPGYIEINQTCQSCPAGTYKNFKGNSTCLPCPNNSISSENGSSQCQCVVGYYRAPGNNATHDCIAEGPPSAPQNVSVDATGTTYVALNWYPPQHSGGTSMVFYTVYYQAYNASQPITLGNVTTTSVTVTNMFPDTEYKVTIVANNGIPGDELKRSVSITVKTKQISTSTDRRPLIIGVALGITAFLVAALLLSCIYALIWRYKQGKMTNKSTPNAAANQTWIDHLPLELVTKQSDSINEPKPLQSVLLSSAHEEAKDLQAATGYYEVEVPPLHTDGSKYAVVKPHQPAVQQLSEPYTTVQPTYTEIDPPDSFYQTLSGTFEYQSMYAVACNTQRPTIHSVTSAHGCEASPHVYMEITK